MILDRRSLMAVLAALPLAGTARAGTRPQPVIFHTDIGGDIDDTWALLLLLRRPELDLKLVVTEGSNAVYRGRIVAKLLTLAGRSDVPIAIGPDGHDDAAAQSDWLGNFRLTDYRGQVSTDGPGHMASVTGASRDPVTIISVGPATTVAAALALDPALAEKARFVGMFGSVRQGYGAGKPPEPEYNVKQDVRALQAVFAAPWDITITPLDTCGLLVLDGAGFQTVRASSDPFARACIANSEAWLPHASWMPKDFDLTQHSSTLFDAVAVVMACDESDLVMEDLPLRVADDGMTVIDEAAGRPVHVATSWRDLDGFKAKMVAALTAKPA